MPDPIEHVIVLMFENNSFDRMLGCMQAVYPKLDGVDPNAAQPRTNPDFPDATHTFGQLPDAAWSISTDPGHDVDDVTRQVYNGCQGFVADFVQHAPQAPQADRYQIMAYFKLDSLPILHTLARQFLICDRWFCSVPAPTWPNRFFVHSGTSLGHVDMPDGFFHPALHCYDQPTVYQRLSERQVSWKIYYGDIPQSLVLLKQWEHAANYHRLDDFFQQAGGAAQDFPQYVFIEPYYFGAKQNDEHPPTDVRHGEILLAQVYNAIRANEDLWRSSMLVVLYDEHGGFYDHVVPPATIPPDDHTKDFAFDKLGVRIPALLISPWIDAGVLSTEFDHTSLLKYATDKWNLGPLGNRTARANSFGEALLRRATARDDCPRDLQPPAADPNPADAELNQQQAALAGFSHHLEVNQTKPDDATIVRHTKALAGSYQDQSEAVAERVRQFLEKAAKLALLLAVLLPLHLIHAQVPTFQRALGGATYTLPGRDPAQSGATTIPTVLVPVTLSFGAKRLDAAPDVPLILRSPIFAKFAFGSSGETQYADAMLRATFPDAAAWHTLLGRPEVRPVRISVPAGNGYVLTSKKTGAAFAVADVEFVQREIFKQIPKQPGKLIVAVTHNTTYFTEGDDTLCCSWGTHGVDTATGNSFVLASYIGAAPPQVTDRDVQPLTQQLAEFINDPLHNPLLHGRNGSGNHFPAWARTGEHAACGGTGAATAYFLLEPTNTNPKNHFPSSKAFLARAGGIVYHLQNAALLAWYTGGGGPYSFPDPQALTAPAVPCPPRGSGTVSTLAAGAAPRSPGESNGHNLIGYWAGYGSGGSTLPLRDISQQWDIIIVAFATPDHNAPEGTMQFRTPGGLDAARFKSDVAWMKDHGKKVMISLGGGGQHFNLADPARVPAFVDSVTRIVETYGFDGIDIDFETPSLNLDAGDTDFRHPTTPSVVNLISALRQLRRHFGTGFMISLVPEGSQVPAGYPTYGGQFGSYLPIIYALRDILSFVDVQDYNTPPLQGLDGEIYQPGTVDYHAAMTELLLHGFNVGSDARHPFPPLAQNQVAVGFLTGDTTPAIVTGAMQYVITGRAPAGTTYKLRRPAGYPGMLGAMFWTINADRRAGYPFSNAVGPQLHAFPAGK